MTEYTMNDLFRLSRAELLTLDHQMAMAISSMPERSEQTTVALINQRRIRRELGRRDFERDF
jgi:hypothetical protein